MSKKSWFINNYHIWIPLLITFLIYAISLIYGFRNFDEDILIKNFYTHKTFQEYIEKFFLVHAGGASKAHGFSFSGVQNTHVCFLGMPTIYLVAYLFKANPFLYHSWSLLLHSIAVVFLVLFAHRLTQDKKIAMFTACAWTLHPTNVESIIWATNWLQCLGAGFYFFILWWITSIIHSDMPWHVTTRQTFSIMLFTTIAILFTEHTITIPIAIFVTTFYLLNNLKQKNALQNSIKTSLPSFVVIFSYWLIRNLMISKAIQTSSSNGFHELLNRLLFLTPQVFIHQIKLVLFPANLTIDQLDLLHLDQSYFRSYHLICLITIALIGVSIFLLRKSFPFLSYGLLMYTVTLLSFIQIIPLYSMSAERYNYFGSAFIVLGIISTIFQLNKFKKTAPYIAILWCLILGIRGEFRIWDWKDSKTLFRSTINTSKSFLKKGIWTYNLAICEEDIEKKKVLLTESNILLKRFIQQPTKRYEIDKSVGLILTKYELDPESLLAKASDRIATNYEILGDKKNQLKYLNKALKYSRPKSQSRSLIYKNLGTYYFQESNYKKSLDYYFRSYEISPNPTISYAISICYLKLNDFNNYEKYLKEAASVISPYNVSPFKTYGQFLELEKHDYANALKYYKIASLLENNVEPYILLSSLYLKQTQINKAYEIIKNGLHSFPENPTLIYFRGTVNLNKGKINDGLQDLINVIKKTDTSNDIKIEACHILVNLFLNQNDYNNAKKYNDLILSINPNDKEANELKRTEIY